MAPTSKPAEKKQQTISKFFAARTINGLAAAQQSKPSTSPSTSPSATPKTKAGSKRSHEDDGKENPPVDGEEGNANGKVVKRSRAGTRRRVFDDEDEFRQEVVPNGNGDDKGEANAKEQEMGNPAPKGPEGVVVSSSIADRFTFSQSREQNPDVMAVDEDPDVVRRREALHCAFVEKLASPNALPRPRIEDSAAAAAAAGSDEEGEEEKEKDPAPAPALRGGRAGAKKAGGKAKLTPMEMQVVEIKKKHMDTLLVVEVGYKFRFFGEDARVAAKELGIVCIPGKYRFDEHPSEAHLDKFASASIPVHRLHVHAKRLVAAGHKVGVVRQLETAALKRAGSNRNAPFVRKLTNLYTKGTYIDETGDVDNPMATPGASSGGYLLCLAEDPAGSATGSADEKVTIGLIAVQPGTGDIIHDVFDDGFLRSELETRLLHISPCEFLIVGNLSKATDKLIQHLSGTKTNVFGDRSRVERVSRSKTAAQEAFSQVTTFYAKRTAEKAVSEVDEAQQLQDKALGLPDSVIICLAAMIVHLTEYGLEHIFQLTKYFESFSTRSHMLVNGTTIESLEVYRNSTDHTERGSLFWAVDKTQTRFGKRLLRKWLGRPLLDGVQLEQRQDAVAELFEKQSTAQADQLQSLLKTTKADLERSLIRIYYGKCTRPELVSTLQTLQRIGTHYSRLQTPQDTGFSSPLIADALLALPPIASVVVPFLDRINAAAASKDDKYAFFRDGEHTEAMIDHTLAIAAVEQELDAHRADAAEKLGRKRSSPIVYSTVAGVEYLVEVSNTDLKRVPASWLKISGTKRVSRFHTPEIIRMVAERDQSREALAAACDQAFKDLLAAIAAEYQPLRDAVAALSNLDCLYSLAKVAAMPGYSRPTILPSHSPPSVSVTAGRHPVAELLLVDGYIPFSTTLSSPGPLAHVITGPNMGGKSSFVRAVALLVLLAQIGSFVPADQLSLTLTDAIFTRMGARDNLFAGESTFMVELSETGRILRSATPRSLVILDELGRGTSTHDGAAIAHAVLDYIVHETRCLTLFITHYQNLARVAEGLGDGLVKNVHMRFQAMKHNEDGPDGDEEITFLYEVAEGMAHRSYGLNVARLARLPPSVIEVAGRKSHEMETEIKARLMGGAVQLLGNLISGGTEDQLDHLISSIEQL